jgi:hypothetical protein
MLCDRGLLGTVEVTQGGQRRIARDRVLVYRDEHLRRRTHLDKIGELVAPVMEAELADATAAFERDGWRFGGAPAARAEDKDTGAPLSSRKPARKVISPASKRTGKAPKGKATKGSDLA